jgi:ammonia channel protein AmtB
MTPWPAFFIGIVTGILIIFVVTFIAAARENGDDTNEHPQN